MAYDNTNTGILSKNDRKTEASHPDVRGSVNVDGVEYWLSGWRKIRKDGSGTFYSLVVQRKDAAPATAAKPSPEAGQGDEDIPF